MATILLSAAGAAVGGAFGGTAFGISTAMIGRAIGATVGRMIDQAIIGTGSEVIETGRLERYRLTGASEGAAIPDVYGRMRIAGQVIWSSRFNEHVSTSDVGGKGVGRGAQAREYSYSVSLAIALCEGEILRIGRIWADGMEIGGDDLDFRVYTGSVEQEPDPKIEAVEGIGNAPAYRGTAYVVFEDLQLANYGNRVPQFSFEVIRATRAECVPEECRSLSETIEAVALIPGTGEYLLATTPVHYSSGFGWNKSANVHSVSGMTDFSTSLEHLGLELPRCKSVSLVVSWFGNDLRCPSCDLVPKVEQSHTDGTGMPWRVGGLAREDAETVVRIDDRPVYGGTPSDQSVVEAIRAISESGKDVMFYPFILMEQMAGNTLADPWTGDAGQPVLPWRGRITTSRAAGIAGSADGSEAAVLEVRQFFGSARASDFSVSHGTVEYSGADEWSYRRFILHYAHLCAAAGGVVSFCIGSEMRGLTQIRGSQNSFPAVEELRDLAAEVRTILGATTKIGYAADWSEYFGFQPDDGSGDVFFHLDPLWADDNIDFVGIDNYMPVSDWRDGSGHSDAHWKSIYNIDYLKSNICGGEGYDWYYADADGRDAQVRLPIEDAAHSEPWVFRYKDIVNWWSRPHYNRVAGVREGIPTAWAPESKPVWFTELGCAAVDKATNQPNKFVDPKSSESGYPYHSNGMRDDYLQQQYLRALHGYWNDPENNPVSTVYGDRMVDMSRAHVWAWDARPYPAFPSRNDVWSDGENYLKGHWLNGRTTSESLAAVVSEICSSSGLPGVDVSELYGLVRGYAIGDVAPARAALQPLALAGGFDSFEREGALCFRSRISAVDVEIESERVAVADDLDGKVEYLRSPAAEMAGRVRLNFIEAEGDFATRSAEAIFPDEQDQTVATTELPLCMSAAEGTAVVERWLSEARVARDRVRLALPPSQKSVGAGDTIRLTGAADAGAYRVDQAELGEAQVLEAVRVEPDLYQASGQAETITAAREVSAALPVYPVFLDIPLLSGSEDPVAPHVAIAAHPWPGKVAIYSSATGEGYRLNTLIGARTTIGATETPLHAAAPGLFDNGPPLRLRIGEGLLSSAETNALLAGANQLAIGDPATQCWEILQFRKAVLVGPDTYEVSGRLRGQAGTDGVMPDVWPAGSTAVLLNGSAAQIDLSAAERGLERHYLIGPAGRSYDDPSYLHLASAFDGAGLRPYSPAHLRCEAVDDGSLMIRWIRRTRIDGDSWASYEVPLGEESERYLLQISSAGRIRREALPDEPKWSYSADMRSEDALSAPFEIRVAQMSERYGAGPFRRIEINV
ncbi:baseplate multidomain protein megatron [Tropicimonas sp.]|uniref:baseplate multidomain protein megatron n=1 Tax=Tropicimonas sp. TaxID=2067044 RepID=UPI003A8B655A